MKWFGSDRHRQHDPEIEIWAGLPGPATEVPARAEAIAAALTGDEAFERAEVTEHGLGPVERIHDPALVRWLEGAWAECRPLSPQREVIPDTRRTRASVPGRPSRPRRHSAASGTGASTP